jgi:hypothetical protein
LKDFSAEEHFMKKVIGIALLSSLFCAVAFAATSDHGWPTLKAQIDRAHAPAGSALEKLIQANQDFSLLRADEAYDNLRIPLWLRVHWRKAHPEGNYSAADPTGGYPLVLKEVAEWMEHHPDLRPGRPEAPVPPTKATAGTNLRISGSATVSRSESDIRVNYWNTQKIIGASNNIGGSGQQAQFYSSDGGATWGQTSLPLQTGDAFHSDPTVDWTSDGTAWSTTIGINSTGTTLKMRAYKSTNGGATWTFDNTFSGTQTNTDKQMIWVDHSATSPFKDNLYACWHNGAPQFFNRRTGPAGAWQTQLQISGTETTGTAIGCDVKTNSAGDVFVFWPDTGSRRVNTAKSTNGGVSFGAPVRIATTFDSFDIGVPSFNSRRQLIYTSGGAYRTATKNMVYAVWSDLTGATGCASASNEPGSNAASTCKTRIWLGRSSDGGATWGTPVMINNPSSLNDQYNPWLVVDETNGQIAVMYYDTVADSTRKKTDVYYQASFDDGATWMERAAQGDHGTDRRDGLRRRFGQPVRRLQQPLRLRRHLLPLLDRPPQQRQGGDLDRRRAGGRQHLHAARRADRRRHLGDDADRHHGLLDRLRRRHLVQDLPFHHQRRPVQPGRHLGDDLLHRFGPDLQHHLLLRGHRLERHL